MAYTFDEVKFKKTFNVNESKPLYERRLEHVYEMGYKLYPNKANTKVDPIVDMRDVIGGFVRNALKINQKQLDSEELCQYICEQANVSEEDQDSVFNAILGVFFKRGKFTTNNIGLYPYQVNENNKESDELAYFLYCVLGDSNKIDEIVNNENLKKFNVIEEMIYNFAESNTDNGFDISEPYVPIHTALRKVFLKDLKFMLETGMSSVEDLSDLFSLYYFQYYVQTSLVLDKFYEADPNKCEELFYALDWEKVSKHRKCCTSGWDKVKNNVSHGFAHKTTLGILNNNVENRRMNYLDFYELSKEGNFEDNKLSKEIRRAESIYTFYLGDYKEFERVEEIPSKNKSEAAIRHLFACVEAQFSGTTRWRARQSFNEKFTVFCRKRWIKDRKKSGLVLNLTERDVIFLTKLAIGNNDKIRLNDMFKEYQNRGVYLDDTSKNLLQEYFAKLNIIDKKSDSGDAQYVRRIL